MLARRLHGSRGVPLLDCSKNLCVSNGGFFTVGAGHGWQNELRCLVRYGFVHLLEKLVAAGIGDDVVELEIAIRKGGTVVEFSPGLTDNPAKLLQVVLGPAQGGQAREFAFKENTRFIKLLESARVVGGEKRAYDALQTVDADLVGHDRAFAVAHLNQPQCAQARQPFPQREAADAKLLLQHPFAREFVSRPELARLDLFNKVIKNRLGGRTGGQHS